MGSPEYLWVGQVTLGEQSLPSGNRRSQEYEPSANLLQANHYLPANTMGVKSRGLDRAAPGLNPGPEHFLSVGCMEPCFPIYQMGTVSVAQLNTVNAVGAPGPHMVVPLT